MSEIRKGDAAQLEVAVLVVEPLPQAVEDFRGIAITSAKDVGQWRDHAESQAGRGATLAPGSSGERATSCTASRTATGSKRPLGGGRAAPSGRPTLMSSFHASAMPPILEFEDADDDALRERRSQLRSALSD